MALYKCISRGAITRRSCAEREREKSTEGEKRDDRGNKESEGDKGDNEAGDKERSRVGDNGEGDFI